MKPKKISLDQATAIVKEQLHGENKRCVLVYRGQWYDIRGLTKIELVKFQSKLTGIPEWQIFENYGTLNIDL